MIQANPSSSSAANHRVLLSVVVPCFNEEEALPELLRRLVPPLETAVSGAWEIILVDDGSMDRTSEMIAESHQRDSRIRGVILSRNFGHQAAIFAGLAYASGAYIGIMDADLQDPPEVLIQCYQKAAQEHFDLVYAVRKNRQASPLLKLAYWAFYRVMRALSEYTWPVDTGDFSVVNRKVLNLIMELPEHIRVLRGLRSWVGLRQGFIAYDRPERAQGESKYSLIKLFGLALNALVSFSSLPLRVASVVGIGMSFLTFLLGGFVIVNRFSPKFTLFGYYVGANPGTTTIVTLLLVISSLLFLCLGILGEYLALLIKEVKRRPAAIIRERFGIGRRAKPTRLILEARDDESE